MSWIDKELKKRTTAGQQSRMPPPAQPASASQSMAGLWEKLEGANNALPPELRLPADFDLPGNPAFELPAFRVWFRAPNGAGLGFTGDAIRYVWPESNVRASYNFWIRWTPDRGFVLARRVISPFTGLKIVERPLDDRRAEFIIKCLVVGRRIKHRALCRKRMGLF